MSAAIAHNRQNREDKSDLFKILIKLAIPTILEEILTSLLQYVDTAMVGKLGENATASVSVTTTITWLIHCFPGAVSIAALSLISQAYGSGDKKQIKRSSNQLTMIVIYMGIIIGGLSLALSPFIPTWMGADVSIRHQASVYFAIISIPMMFRCASRIFGSAIRATKDTKTPLIVNMSANVLNVILNYVFIYILGLGVNGAGIATAISYSLGGIVMYICFRNNEILEAKEVTLKPDWDIIQRAAKVAVPVMMTSIASCFGYVVFASLVTGMGNTIFAAHSIAVTAESIFYVPGYGLRTATATLIGISIGENNQEKFDSIIKLSILFTIFIMIISGAILFFTSYPLMCFFTSSEKVAEIGSDVLKMVAFSEPFFGLMIAVEGIYYGMGKTKYPFVIETFCMWGIRIVFTYICVKILGFGIRAVWYCMIADNVGKATLLFLPILSKKRRSIEGAKI